ncbi:MAG: 4Fe-4S dicluster domain-containing protein [Deltaproteobacteria bacterium]|nr:4Fe-4S dicluster domain-containing protein [Deltaproteobacteria bacterium]
MENVDILITMQEDLKRALKKPEKDRKLAMLIDMRKCSRCHACTAGCVAENASPPGILYRPVFEEEKGTFPKVKRLSIARPCMQCDDPPCVAACPNKGKGKATWKSSEGVSAGIVMINYEQCIGCGKCVPACPYRARALDSGKFHSENAPAVPEYEKRPSDEYGRKWERKPPHLPVGTARKCHFCLHRVKNGMLTMCTTTCTCRANYFGDESDPESLIAKVKKANKVVEITKVTDQDPQTGKVAFGKSATRPRVYYIPQEA